MRGWCNLDLADSRSSGKTDRKNAEKTAKLNIHFMALVNAVEHGQVEKIKTILQNNAFDINGVNSNGLTVLDIAVMMGDMVILKTLQQAGAIDSRNDSLEHRLKQMDELVSASERRRADLASSLLAGYSKETERQHQNTDRRCKFLRRMKAGLEKLNAPNMEQQAVLDVIDSTRVRVAFTEPLCKQNIFATKLKVEWSADDWESVRGCVEVSDARRRFAVVEDLRQGERVHFRVGAGNATGFGPLTATFPPSAVPSGWRDIDNRTPRLEGLLGELDTLFKQIRNSRPDHASEIKVIEPSQEAISNQRKAQKKKSLMQLFTHAPRFQKSLKRGSYLATILCCGDKILVTTEDFPPVIEIDDNYLTAAKSHFHWLMKVANTWEDVKSLRQDMEQAGSASQLPYRIKLLQAAAAMQSALGIQDLGQFYHSPIKDANGTYVYCTVKHVQSTKIISSMNFRWVPLSKLKERKTSVQGGTPFSGEPISSAGDLLLYSLRDQIRYDLASQLPLGRGLYLAYLKLQSSVDQLQVIVPVNNPNMFPYVKLRENSHVSREEWEWIKFVKGFSSPAADDPGGGVGGASQVERSKQSCGPSVAQSSFHKLLIRGSQQLFQELSIDKKQWREHRLYTEEVLELSPDVTVLLLLPQWDAVCCAPGQEDALVDQPKLMSLPLYIFEMTHMGSYQGDLLGRYMRLSYILEMDTLMAQHASREAFSESEVTWTKDRISQLKQFQLILESIWKKFRWVLDVITYARDKATPGLLLSSLCKTIEEESCREIPHLVTGIKYSATENKRFRQEYESNFRNKKVVVSSLHKSNTADDLSNLSPNEVNLFKSNTSDCVFDSTNSLNITKSDPFCTEMVHCLGSNDLMPLVQWTAEEPGANMMENSMYEKRPPAPSDENLLTAHYAGADFPPRKSSAPCFLETGQVIDNLNPAKDIASSVSLDTLTSNVNQMTRNSGASLSSKKDSNSPSSSCGSDVSRRYGAGIYTSDKRTTSSLSHESKTSASMSYKSASSTNADDSTSLDIESVSDTSRHSEDSAVIQVYAAYETGLASGTSVKLNLTPRTTAREVIDLVVKQLNMAVMLKNKNAPLYGAEKLNNFCLVAVIGARERCLRDDFQPLQLQNPWKKGRLYVRLKSDLLAAIEQNNSKYAYL